METFSNGLSDKKNIDVEALYERKEGSTNEVSLRNPYIKRDKQDVLYHIGLDSGTQDLRSMFGDVKFVCMGGTKKRMEAFAHYIKKEIGYEIPMGTELADICHHASRYSMYKIGPVLSVNHGMGISSINILLHELIKLMFHAKCKDPVFIRMGTSGGIGLSPGTVTLNVYSTPDLFLWTSQQTMQYIFFNF